jgi:hypothetical protein
VLARLVFSETLLYCDHVVIMFGGRYAYRSSG